MPAALAPLRAEPSRARVPGPTDQLRIDVVIPVYNEEHDLPRCVQRLRAYLDASIPYSSMITIVDNASTDGRSARASSARIALKPHCASLKLLRSAPRSNRL